MVSLEDMSDSDKPLILVVDDVPANVYALCGIIEHLGYNTIQAYSGKEAWEKIQAHEPDIVMLDLIMPDMRGEEVLKLINAQYQDIAVVVVTMDYQGETVDKCMELGAHGFISKPIIPLKIKTIICDLLRVKNVQPEKEESVAEDFPSQDYIEKPKGFENFITSNRDIIDAMHMAVSGTRNKRLWFLITGEKGVGKSFFSRQVADIIAPDGEFAEIVIDEDNLPANLEDVLKKGSSDTNYIKMNKIPVAMQSELVDIILNRKLSDGSEFKAGIVIASNKNLKNNIVPGSIWEAIYFQSGMIHLHIPSLRDRKEDIVRLIERFLKDFADEKGCTPPSFSMESLNKITRHNFVNNVKELKEKIKYSWDRHDIKKDKIKFYL